MESIDATSPGLLEIPEHHFEKGRAIITVEKCIAESAAHLKKWRKRLKLPALSQPDAELDASDPVWDWSTQAVDDFFHWYGSTVLPRRTSERLAPTWAHGTETPNLFKGGQNTQEWAGITSTGKVRGQFGLFERYDKEFSEGGWRCRKGAIVNRASSDCWVLIDDENARKQALEEERQVLNSISLVFIDPRTYDGYLRELQKRIKKAESVKPHTALRLDQLKAHLQNHAGRFPFEIASTE